MKRPVTQDVVFAATPHVSGAEALMRWLVPVLDNWPRALWNAVIVDGSGPGQSRAALANGDGTPRGWKDIDYSTVEEETRDHLMLCGRAGLAIQAPQGIAREIERALFGIASELRRVEPAAPGTSPYRDFFASFGVRAAH
jgi:hypothetical protein